MTKFIAILFVFVAAFRSIGFAQLAGDGSYFWNSASITCSVNDKTELFLGNKDHYSNQTDRLDYMHFELIGYRRLSKSFSLGFGLRQTESYKLEKWNPGKTYMLYGVFFLNPCDIKIKLANRLVVKTSKTADIQYGLDNISNIDFFVRSTSKFPKPYLMDEVFSIFNVGKVLTVRLYGGFHLLKKPHWGIDLYYCYWKTRSTAEWKDYDVIGLNTKIRL